jgi:hypothetical protein
MGAERPRGAIRGKGRGPGPEGRGGPPAVAPSNAACRVDLVEEQVEVRFLGSEVDDAGAQGEAAVGLDPFGDGAVECIGGRGVEARRHEAGAHRGSGRRTLR